MIPSPKKHKSHTPYSRTNGFLISSAITESLTQSTKKVQEEKEILSKEFSFDKIKAILQRTQRSLDELQFLQKYLSTLPSLMSILSDSGGTDHLLMTIALHLKYERIAPSSMICRLGDKGKKFYIILNGTVSILIPKELKIAMTLFQYVQHLLLLIIIEERELIAMTIKQNKLIYPIEIDLLNQFIQDYQKINVTFMSFDGVEVMLLKSFVAVTSINFEHRKKCSIRTVDEYIKESQPQVKNMTNYSSDLLKSNQSKTVSLFTYFEVIKLSKGNTFGERALITTKNKRTGTILSDSGGVILGTLTRKGFDLCIKDIHKKRLHSNIRFFQSFKIFSTLNWYLFSTKFLNFFKLQTMTHNEMLIKENTVANEIYFVREGEFEVTAKMSDDDIDYYIDLFQHKKKQNRRSNASSEGKKKQMRIALFKEQDIIGLDDMRHKGKYIFNARCISVKAIVFGIEIKAFETIVLKSLDVLDNLKEFVAIRKNMLVSRLESFKYIQLTQTINTGFKPPNTLLDRVRDCFSAKPKSKTREKINKMNHMSPIQNKQLFLASITTSEGDNVTHSKPHIINQPNVNHKHHNSNSTNIDEERPAICSMKPEINQYKSRNTRFLSQYDCHTSTTTHLITMTHNNNNTESYSGMRDWKRLGLSAKFSQSNKKKTIKKPFSNYKPEQFLKKMIGASYKKDKPRLLLSEIMRHNHARSISRDKETIISILDFDKLDDQMTQGNNVKVFEILDQPCPIYHKVLSPKQLPLNYMDKAKPLRLSIKKTKTLDKEK